jgi:dCMP deaminase
MDSRAERAVIAYVPSPHAGYLKLFREYAGGSLYVLGDEFIKEFPALVRNLPAATPHEVRTMVESLGIFSAVRVLTPALLEGVRKKEIIMPDEDVAHAMADKYLAGVPVTFDSRWRLRWDWGATQKKLRPEGEEVVTRGEFERRIMALAFGVADKSPDWWRQISALLTKDEEVLLASFNRHLPSEQSAYLYGDPRSNFEPGVCIEMSVAGHAEAILVATAAKRGISMQGCDLFVSTFPCPPCAYTLAFTGIKRLYYADGYALVAGAETLQSRDIEIIRVDMTHPSP